MLPEIISIGEALVEIMRPMAGVSLDQPGQFLGPFASGAPAIFAVAAARLGVQVGFIGKVGEDAFGRLLHKCLESEGIDLDYLQVSPDDATSAAFVAYSPDGNREFIFYLKQAAAGRIDPAIIRKAYFSGVKWLHISGSFLALSDDSREACRRAVEWTCEAGGKVSFDPNLRPELMDLGESRRVFAFYLDRADLLLPTAEEARVLTATKDDEEAAARLLGDGKRLVVFKRGSEGSTFFTPGKRLDCPGFLVKEVDPTGAGDCFNAACLVGLINNWTLERTARFANAAGALAVTRQGPVDGAPTIAEIESLIGPSQLR
jgi:sugar/nucleoside kinase (ribokinase family)